MLSVSNPEITFAQQSGVGRGSGSRLPVISLGQTRIDYGVILTPHLIVYNTFHDARETGEAAIRLAGGSEGQFIVDYTTATSPVWAGFNASLHIGLSKLNRQNFFGFGNGTTANESLRFYRANQNRYVVEPMLTRTTSGGLASWSFGPVLKHTKSDDTFDLDRSGMIKADHVTAIQTDMPYGTGQFTQLGVQTHLRIGRLTPDATTGMQAQLGAAAYPAMLDVATPFGSVSGEVRGFVSLSGVTSPTLALRVGAKKVVGEAPFFDAAQLGGARSLRSFHEQRFAGDASVFSGAELRVPVGHFNLFKHTTRFGVLGLADVGRVYYQNASPGGWHSAVGGGVWFRPDGWRNTVSVEMARGDEGSKIYLRTGVVF